MPAALEENSCAHRKVLVISRAFPPENTSPVQRPLKFVKYLPSFGWKPYVITPKKDVENPDGSFEKDIPPEAVVYEVFSLAPLYINRVINSRKDYFSNFLILLLKKILKAYSAIYYRLYIVDWHDGWIPFGFIKALQVIRKEKIDAVFIDMEPPSSSIIGLMLNILTGLPMIIDYHDPWTTAIYASREKGVRRKIAEYLEHRIIKRADIITAGKENIISGILKKFGGIYKKKCKTIFSGYDPDDYIGVEKEKKFKLTIGYTGKLSEKFYYSPESFLSALGELLKSKEISRDDISVIFVGAISVRYRQRYDNLIRNLHLENIVINTGNVSHSKCVEYQKNSDILLYIMESFESKKLSIEFSGALPSKLYEYFYTGNPIFAIVPQGFEADLIQKTKTGYIAEPHNVGSVKSVLLKLYKKYKNGTLDIQPDWDEIEKFNRKNLTGKLAGLLNEIL